jgi:hypothetical protein|tara:strand:+ start:226 stop:648 length:423 start_codon:yes stop_codon:yes gene_type:complete
MKKDQLFKKNPSNELFNKVLNAFGLSGVDDNRCFSRKDLEYIKTVDTINALKTELEECYLPCKSRTYLNSLTEKNVITILRQILKTRNYTISSREKYMKGCKFIIYSLAKLDQQTYTPLVEIAPLKEQEETTKPIVLTFN